MVSQTSFFQFLVFLNFFLKVRAKHVQCKNYFLKNSFNFNFLKIVFNQIFCCDSQLKKSKHLQTK